MNASKFFQISSKSEGILDCFWIPLGLGLLLLGLDVFFMPGIFALPLLFLILLIYLAFRLPSWAVAMWTVIYAAVVFTILIIPLADASTDPAFKPYVRTAVFFAGGAAAILLANHRQRLEKGHDALFSVISTLPLTVIVSDVSGNILLLNEQAQRVLKNHIHQLTGLSFFSTFVSPLDQGKSIARYISYFESDHVGTISTMLQTRSDPPLALHAVITMVSVDGRRYAVTVVERVEHMENLPSSP